MDSNHSLLGVEAQAAAPVSRVCTLVWPMITAMIRYLARRLGSEVP